MYHDFSIEITVCVLDVVFPHKVVDSNGMYGDLVELNWVRERGSVHDV